MWRRFLSRYHILKFYLPEYDKGAFVLKYLKRFPWIWISNPIKSSVWFKKLIDFRNP